MQRELERHLDTVRTLETPPEPAFTPRQPYFATLGEPGAPVSPRQMPQDDSRRPSMIRPPVPPHLAASPRRYGSIGAANQSPNYNRPQPPPINPPPPMPHPLSAATPPGPNLARRHTSADIRQHGWPPPGISPFPSTNQPGGAAPWPSSPHRTPTSSDQQVRDVLAQYEMGGPRRFHINSRTSTPPLSSDAGPPTASEPSWSIGGSRFPRHESSLPATRRSSMASNVHSLLNPADTAERPEEDQQMADDRKRKRLE